MNRILSICLIVFVLLSTKCKDKDKVVTEEKKSQYINKVGKEIIVKIWSCEKILDEFENNFIKLCVDSIVDHRHLRPFCGNPTRGIAFCYFTFNDSIKFSLSLSCESQTCPPTYKPLIYENSSIDIDNYKICLLDIFPNEDPTCVYIHYGGNIPDSLYEVKVMIQRIK